MSWNRITLGARVRRGLVLALAALVFAAGLAACGGGGSDTSAATAAAESEADAEILRGVLARQLGVVAAYPQAMIILDARTLALLRKFRAQEGEHADAVVKELRGLGESAEAEPEAIEAGKLKTRRDRLRFVYEMESATIALELTAIANLSSAGARSTLAATVGNQAEHLAILRRLLGAKPLATIPEAFETGTTPAPAP
ncbi:MAG: ferritin-like domain-containing protein [Actinobacteria bacterium]|nr:ferritin-like domain-containing protein [Actinomycetota bacterium]